MKSFISIQLLLMFLLINVVYAQQTSPQKDDDVVKVTTSLVQVDAVVTDKAGNPVTNLTANDFEIWQDGKLQTISNVSFIYRNANRETSNQTQTITTKKPDKNTPLPPPASSRSREFGRILTFVVDDGNCAATRLGMDAIKTGLKKFINEEMAPDDVVAIYRTRAGSSLLQQYTSDKARLLTIAQKIRWYPPDGSCNGTGSNYEQARDNSTGKPDGGTFESDADRDRREAAESFINDKQAEGLTGVLRYAIKGLYPYGGRKILFLMSDSLAIISGHGMKQREITSMNAELRDLANLANRASVVINSIDVRGVTVPMIEAADDVGGVKNNALATDALLADRAASDDSRQSGLFKIADETGGTFYKNMNRLDVPVQKALKSENGYYLIGYQPEEETFKGKNFHKIEVKLKRPELVSTSRAGFYGVTDESMRPKPRTGDSELYDVLAAPLPNADMNIRLSAYFANTPEKGNFIHALLYIDGKDITFADGTNGNKKAVFDIVAVTVNEKGEVIDDSNSTQTVQIPIDKVDEIERNGLIYTVDVPVKKEGTYTFRTALREAATKRIGSSSQLIEVPNLKKDKLYLSGLLISGVDANGKTVVSEAENAKNGFTTVISKSIPAIRQFQRNTNVAYSYTLYNVGIDAKSNQPNLSIQTNLYQDGKLILEGKPQPDPISSQTDMTRIRNFSYLHLNPQVALGDYTLQVIIKDLSTNQTTSQWVDFEVIE